MAEPQRPRPGTEEYRRAMGEIRAAEEGGDLGRADELRRKYRMAEELRGEYEAMLDDDG